MVIKAIRILTRKPNTAIIKRLESPFGHKKAALSYAYYIYRSVRERETQHVYG